MKKDLKIVNIVHFEAARFFQRVHKHKKNDSNAKEKIRDPSLYPLVLLCETIVLDGRSIKNSWGHSHVGPYPF
jgi:hypothetical protein